MTVARAVRSLSLAILAIATPGGEAAGQMIGGSSQAPVPPGPAVFGGARQTDPNAPQLTFSSQVLGGYDDNVAAGETGAIGGGDPRRQLSSKFAGGGLSLQFNQARPRVSYGGSVGAQYRKLFDVEDFDMQAYTAQTMASARLTARSSVFVNVGGGVQPFFQFGLGRGFDVSPTFDPAPFTPDLQASRLQVLRYSGALGYRYEIGPRTSFMAMANTFGVKPVNDEGERTLFRQGARTAGGRIEHRLTQHLSTRTGYFYRTFARFGSDSPRFESHDIDIGLNYARAFDLARSTRLTFSTGSSVVRGTGGFGGTQARTRAFVTGNTELTRTFLRTWGSRLSYVRAANYVEGLQDFAVTDAVSGSLSGLFTDRLDASLGVQWLTGNRAFGGGGRFTTLGGGAQLRFAFTRNVAAFTSYTYARFKFPEGFLLPPGFDRNAERQGIRVGLTFWVDLLR